MEELDLDEEQKQRVDSSIRELSIEIISYQAKTLIKELKKITPDKYSDEACQFACIFFCITQYVDSELQKIINGKNPKSEGRARDLALIIQDLYQFLRFLKASTPENSPPGIQTAIDHLTSLYYPKEKNGEPLCLVRPQWKYNLSYIPFSRWVEKILARSSLDPYEELKTRKPRDRLEKIWGLYFKNWSDHIKGLNLELKRKPFRMGKDHENSLPELPPEQLAILSFARLDTEDPLMYPLLSHELGHFIDLSYSTPKSEEVLSKIFIEIDEIETLFPEKQVEEVVEICRNLNKLVSTVIRELMADILAIRMMGLSYFIALNEFLKSFVQWPQPTLTDFGYPGLAFRLKTAHEALISENNGSLISFLKSNSKCNENLRSEARWLFEYLENWEQRFKEIDFKENTSESNSFPPPLLKLAISKVITVTDDLHKIASDVIPNNKSAQLSQSFFDRIDSLKCDLPPFLVAQNKNEFSEILSAAWTYQLIYGDDKEREKINTEIGFKEYQKTCRLVSKSIELISARKLISSEENQAIQTETSAPQSPFEQNGKGVLSGKNIHMRLDLKRGADLYLGVIPRISHEKQGASLDVHLGNWFATARKTWLSNIDLAGSKEEKERLLSFGRKEVYVGFEHTFVIHPGDFVLGITLEFLALPKDLMAFVEGKSSVGRLGLFVATATQVAPGFHGVVVLELANSGTLPIIVKPGMKIAQLVFMSMDEKLTSDYLYEGSYHCQIRPIN